MDITYLIEIAYSKLPFPYNLFAVIFITGFFILLHFFYKNNKKKIDKWIHSYQKNIVKIVKIILSLVIFASVLCFVYDNDLYEPPEDRFRVAISPFYLEGSDGRSEEALEAYEKAIEINPQNTDAWFNKGNTLGELGRFEEALEAYEKAIEINPQNTDAWNNKGNTLDDLGRSEEALEAYENAIEINPQYSKA